ncbi:hypothetical protein EPN44_07210 [bacterium]|nr:MAG: hypothetical protein EPN44_07210 [bacterium]
MARIVGHLIVGARPEPFLGALLESLAPAVERLFVNDNSGLGERSPHAPTLAGSPFAREGRLRIAHTVFDDFSSARNVCFALDTEADEHTWIAFVDADEVHAEQFARIVARLNRLPREIAYVDGYTWHFFQTFDWYASIERRMSLFRWTPQARWEGKVHEKLLGVPGRRLALPYVYGHYGHVVPFQWAARKEQLYASLGRPGRQVDEDTALRADLAHEYEGAERTFSDMWPRLMRFRGRHPAAVHDTIARIRRERAEHFATVEEIIARHQTPLVRLRNLVRRTNYAQRWRLRVFEGLRYGML